MNMRILISQENENKFEKTKKDFYDLINKIGGKLLHIGNFLKI